MRNAAKWELLPDTAVEKVAEKVIAIKDYVCFGAISKHWHSITLDKRQHRTIANCHQLPFLLIPSRNNDPSRRGLYNAPENRTYQTELQVPHHGRFIGSSHGWLIFENSVTSRISATNPFSGAIIDIAPRFINETIVKAVLSNGPELSPFAIMVIYGEDHNLAMLKSGNSDWTFVSAELRWIQDVIFCNGKFLALETWGSVYAFDVEGNDPTVHELFAPKLCFHMQIIFKKYIVETKEGDLLQVIRFFQDYCYDEHLCWTDQFLVFKWDSNGNNGNARWERVERLGRCALFLGDSYSMSVSSLEFPSCRPNSIYYTDDGLGSLISQIQYKNRGAYDLGVYSMETRIFSRHYILNKAQRCMPPPIWIIPTLKRHGD